MFIILLHMTWVTTTRVGVGEMLEISQLEILKYHKSDHVCTAGVNKLQL